MFKRKNSNKISSAALKDHTHLTLCVLVAGGEEQCLFDTELVLTGTAMLIL